MRGCAPRSRRALQGKRTAIISKSLFGKAHTVMAEGGCAAAMGNVNPNDNWQVHYRDTMRGGKFLNNWRMAELHAKEAPDRVWELETYGALFDRTKDGKISQRNFGGHTYPRLAHVGDRTGLELIRTLQQKIVSLQQEDFKETGDYESYLRVFHECTITDLFVTDGRIAGCFGYFRSDGQLRPLRRAGDRAGDGRGRQELPGHEQLLGVHRRRARPGPARGRHADQHGVPAVPPHGHGLAAVGEGDPRHRVGPRRRRGAAQLRGQAVHVRLHPGRVPRAVRRRARTRATAGTPTPDNNRRPPELLPRDEVARAINSEVKAGRGSPHGGVFLDIASRRSPEEILKRLPSMYHQFKELADVDITKEPMEVGPTCHYVMGGVEVDPDTGDVDGARAVRGGRVLRRHARQQPAGRQLAVGPAGVRPAVRAGRGGVRRRPRHPAGAVRRTTSAPRVDRALLPFSSATDGGENPFVVQLELQKTMHDLVGIIRKADEMEMALKKLPTSPPGPGR